MNRVLHFLLFIAFANVATAQVADDFEFIDHKVRTAIHGVSKVIGNDFIYVSHNQESNPMTSVIKVNTHNNAVDTILTTFASSSSIKEFDDGSFQIFITTLFDYDVILPGFYSIESDGNTIQVDSIFVFDDNFNGAEHYYPFSVAKTVDDEYYFNAYESLYRLNADETVDTLPVSDYDMYLFQNKNKKIYGFSGSSLYEIASNGREFLLDLGQQIYAIENNGDYNDVLFEGKLERWLWDFSEKVIEWEIPGEIYTFYELEVDSTNVTAMVREGNKFSFERIDKDGINTMLYNNEYENQGIKGFHRLSEDKMLLIGSDSIADVDYNTLFFRNIDFNEEIEYQSRNVSIDSYEIFQFLKEDVFQYVNTQTGDSIFQTYYSNDLELTFTNQSDSIIRFTDLRSSKILEFWFYKPVDHAIENMLIQPGESYTFQETKVKPSSLKYLVMAIPGADFRFNHDPNKIAYPNFTSDIDDVDFNLYLKLYPNPTNEVLNLSTEGEIGAVEIYNAIGQLVYFKSARTGIDAVDVSRLELGTYYVKARVNGFNAYAAQKFVKVNQ